MDEATEKAFESIRNRNGLRALTEDEEGLGIDDQPAGVFGFTYSPAAENFPLFRTRKLRCYEAHKRSDGSAYLLGFLNPDEAASVRAARERVTVHLFAEPQGEATELMEIPMARVVGHKENSQRGAQGLELYVAPVS